MPEIFGLGSERESLFTYGTALTRDGRLLALSSGPRHVHLYDPRTGKRLREIRADRRPLRLAFSPDGRLLAGHSGKALTVWEIPGGRVSFSAPLS